MSNTLLFSHGYGDRPIWDMSMIITDEDGKATYARSGKKKYRCSACQWEGGSSAGISTLLKHFTATGRAGRCPKVTPHIGRGLSLTLPAGISLLAYGFNLVAAKHDPFS